MSLFQNCKYFFFIYYILIIISPLRSSLLPYPSGSIPSFSTCLENKQANIKPKQTRIKKSNIQRKSIRNIIPIPQKTKTHKITKLEAIIFRQETSKRKNAQSNTRQKKIYKTTVEFILCLLPLSTAYVSNETTLGKTSLAIG